MPPPSRSSLQVSFVRRRPRPLHIQPRIALTFVPPVTQRSHLISFRRGLAGGLSRAPRPAISLLVSPAQSLVLIVLVGARPSDVCLFSQALPGAQGRAGHTEALGGGHLRPPPAGSMAQRLRPSTVSSSLPTDSGSISLCWGFLFLSFLQYIFWFYFPFLFSFFLI